MDKYDFSVYGTQCGGLVKFNVKCFTFVEKPYYPGFGIGDVMPEDWGITEQVNATNISCNFFEHEYLDGYCKICNKHVEIEMNKEAI